MAASSTRRRRSTTFFSFSPKAGSYWIAAARYCIIEGALVLILVFPLPAGNIHSRLNQPYHQTPPASMGKVTVFVLHCIATLPMQGLLFIAPTGGVSPPPLSPAPAPLQTVNAPAPYA